MYIQGTKSSDISNYIDPSGDVESDLVSKVKVKLNFTIRVGVYVGMVCILTVLASNKKTCMKNHMHCSEIVTLW